MEGSEIKHFYDLLTHREEIDVIYEKYAETEGQMSTTDLLNFLLNEQREQVSRDYAEHLIEKYEVDGKGRVGKRSISLPVLYTTPHTVLRDTWFARRCCLSSVHQRSRRSA